MTTPARPRAADSTRSSWQDPEPTSVPAPATDDDLGDEAWVVDLTGVEGEDVVIHHRLSRPAVPGPLQVDGEDADDHPMAETESTPPRREAGVSFPMTTTAQVELRDAIRARTQQRLEDLRARTSA